VKIYHVIQTKFNQLVEENAAVALLNAKYSPILETFSLADSATKLS